MDNPLHRFFWEDSEFRGWAYTLIAVAGVLYATTRTLVFHRPERQVAVELFVLVLVLNSAAIALNYLWSRESSLLSATDIDTLTKWQSLGGRGVLAESTYLLLPAPSMPRTFRLSLKVRYGGLVACLILLSAPKLSVSKVQAAIVNRRLESAALSIEPDKASGLSNNQLKTRFQKIASIASTSTQYKIPANPSLVAKVTTNLEETLRSVSPGEDVRRSGVAAFVALVAYARANNVLLAVNVPTILLPHGETGNSMVSQVPLKNGAVWWQGSAEGSTIFGMPEPSSEPVFPISHSSVVFNAVNFNAFGMRRAFVGTDNESQVVIMNATIEGAAQELDAIVWLNIKFKNSQIIYSGGPLYLGDVTFDNCQFQFGSDPESQKVLAQIKATGNQPVTRVSGL
jgi:hypothetical protein